jgi:CDP-glucose 4,6-dehydratase
MTLPPVPQVLAGKRVFLTGHTGFKGSWLTIWLHRLGAHVTGYALPPPTTPSNFVVSRVQELVDSHHEADIRDGARLGGAVNAADPDVVFHLAAQPVVRESYAHPRDTFEVNVIGTASLLDAVAARGKPCAVVVVTSDKCYENREHVWGYRETDPLGGHDPYSASKAAAELVAAAYRRSFFPPDKLARHGIKIATARAGNVIGGGDWAIDRLVPDAVRSLTNGQEIPLRNPKAVRPWQHVLDPLAGYLLLASQMLERDDVALCEAWNFGPLPGEDVSVSRLTEWFIEAWGDGSWVDAHRGEQPHEAGMLRLSIEKSISQLGWMPCWGLRQAVQRAARWYSRHARTGECMLDACLADIADFERSDQPRIAGGDVLRRV